MPNVLIDGLKERIYNAIRINQSVGILIPGSNYSDLVQSIFEVVKNNQSDAWVYVSVTKPYDILTKKYEFLKTARNIRFIDCVSRVSGLTNNAENCIFLESPSMLEKLSLEITNVFKEVDPETKKYLVIDSISNLIVYNDPGIVREFFYHIINRTRARDIHTISLAVEEEGMDSQINRLIYLNDKILKVRDSFI